MPPFEKTFDGVFATIPSFIYSFENLCYEKIGPAFAVSIKVRIVALKKKKKKKKTNKK